jgi:hypothetical protein
VILLEKMFSLGDTIGYSDVLFLQVLPVVGAVTAVYSDNATVRAIAVMPMFYAMLAFRPYGEKTVWYSDKKKHDDDDE